MADTPAKQGRRSEGEGGNQLAAFLPYQLSITSNAVSSLIAERYRKRFALKITEWRVMAVLGDAGNGDGDSTEASGTSRSLTQRALAEITLMDKVAVNRACKVLEERGLIKRAANELDGRSHMLELTQEGRAIHAEVMPMARATERELLGELSAEQEEALRDMLLGLRQRASELLKQAE